MDKKKKADEEYAQSLALIERDKAQAEKDAAEEKNELARKAFDANKANQIASIVMNSAVAIMKAWADLGPLAATAATVAIGTLAGVQTSQIANQQFVPMYAKGGAFLQSGQADAVIVVVDASCLRRGLILALQLRQQTWRLVLCVNLMDEAARRGVTPQIRRLGQLLDVPVVATAARSGKGLAGCGTKYCRP